MKDAISLSDSLYLHARHGQAAPALIAAGQSWSYAELLADAQAEKSSTTSAPNAPLIASGSSLALARQAYRCAIEKRPFWPVDRNNPAGIEKNRAALQNVELPGETALIISTSGSEGEARAVLLGSTGMAAAARASNQHLPLHPGDIWLNCLPLYHIGGQSILWRCAQAGASVLLHEGFSIENIAVDLEKYPVSHISLVPAMLAQLLDKQITAPTSLRHVLVGGAALAPALYEKALGAGWPVYPSYGMSETSAQIATYHPTDGPWQQGLVGKALTGSEIAIDTNGRIRVRGQQLMLGYLDGSGIDADGWLTTGDLGRIDATGCLTVTGRADDMLISGGRNIHPIDVEACLAACPGIIDVAVTGQPDPVWGDLVVALIVGTAGAEQITRHARQHLPSAAVPRKLVFLDRLPRNPTGKLVRAELRQLAGKSTP
jgi:O-succinylbenzoic acid--CoA ligase